MAIVLKTWGQQLQEVQSAITAVMSSQRYEINGRSVQKADLEFLHKREVYLTEKYSEYGDVLPSSVKTSGSALVSFS